ncbi:hypothetical protein M9458_023508, partial [Cirrhinus mrigala]
AMRKDFILSKYMEWQFAQRSGGSPETKRKYLQDAPLTAVCWENGLQPATAMPPT